MSIPDNQSDYVTCSCQHCNGHIKFGADQLRKGETRRIECPHCHLETIIFHPHVSGKDSPPAGKINPAHRESSILDRNAGQPKSARNGLFLLRIIRLITMIGAILVLIAFIIVGFLTIQTLMPEKPEIPTKIVSIPYETVAPVQQTPFVPTSANIAGKNSFPQPVVDFLLAHEGFSLKKWLDQLTFEPPEHRKAFLDNLAVILQTANTKHLAAKQLEQVVSDFSDMWISLNEQPPDPNAALKKQNVETQKQIFRAICILAEFGLLITLTFSFQVLVLSAIERNTRNKDSTATR